MLVLCDPSDIPVNLTQFLNETKAPRFITMSVWFLWNIQWTYIRIYGFVVELVLPLVYHYQKKSLTYEELLEIMVGIGAVLMLLILNIFWQFMMLHQGLLSVMKKAEGNYLGGVVEKRSSSRTKKE